MAQLEQIRDRRMGQVAVNPGNQSRNGFLYNCYTTTMGRFFQETIKVWLEKGLKRIHDKEIPRYDKEAFVFGDPRLKILHDKLLFLNEKYLNDSDKGRKRELMQEIEEIALFMMKEDIYWRRVWLPFLVEFSEFVVEHKEVFALTDIEQENARRFG